MVITGRRRFGIVADEVETITIRKLLVSTWMAIVDYALLGVRRSLPLS